MPDDLTFTQLKNTSGGGLGGKTLVNLDPNYGPVIYVNALLTDNPIDSLDDKGVVEFVYKLLEKCYLAQTLANENAAQGNKLNAFNAATYGTPKEDIDGRMRVQSTQQVLARLLVEEKSIIGTRV